MRGKLLCTADVPERQKFAYWQDLICDVLVNLDCSAPQPSGFSGSIYDQHFGDLQITTMVSDQMSLLRSPQRIARAREDYFLVAIEGRGRSFGSQDGREAVLDRDDFALFDSTRPYDVGFKPGFQHFVVKIPRRLLLNRVGPVHSLTGTRIPGDRGAGRIAAQFFRTLQQELDHIDAATAERLGETGLDLLAAALASIAPGTRLHETAARSHWLMRIKTYVNAHLADPNLSPRTVAAALGISVRYLNMLFGREEKSVDKYIWDLRLQKCRAALADPAQRGHSISTIAFGWGFSEMSHFSRAFKQSVGMSPREFRLAADGHDAGAAEGQRVSRSGGSA